MAGICAPHSTAIVDCLMDLTVQRERGAPSIVAWWPRVEMRGTRDPENPTPPILSARFVGVFDQEAMGIHCAPRSPLQLRRYDCFARELRTLEPVAIWNDEGAMLIIQELMFWVFQDYCM